MAAAFSLIDTNHKLLMSTCKTHRHTYNAIAYEAHAWSHKGVHNFSGLSGLNTLNIDAAKNEKCNIIDTLYWCIQFIRETYRKYRIFHSQFHRLKKGINTAFKKLGNPYQRFWQLLIESDIAYETEPEIEQKFALLMPLIDQMALLTSYTYKVFVRAKIIGTEELAAKFEDNGISLYIEPFRWVIEGDVGDTAYSYNENIAKGSVPGISIVKAELPEDIEFETVPQRKETWKQCINAIADCYMELKKSLNIYCPEYDIEEGDFPFAPKSNFRRYLDGSIETLHSNTFILTMDIIGSTDSPQTNTMKLSIIRILKNFRSVNVYHEISGNDSYIVCADEPLVLLDIIEAVRTEGDKLKHSDSHFGGTRKGLSFGAVKIIEGIDHSIAIMDAEIPNVIPGSFSILDGIDDQAEKDIWDSLVIMNGHVKEKYSAIIDRFSDSKDINVKSKHYVGNGIIINLDSRKN